MIDLRSDTVTRPDPQMRAAMAAAEVGDDVYGEDPTVRALEERVAALFGKEAALFTPTGSMANVLAVRSVVGAGEEVLCESSAHIARAELGAHAAYTGLTMRTWTGHRGGIDLPAIASMFAPDIGPFFVPTRAISVENTHNFGGGTVLPLGDLQALRAYADSVGAAVHLDGARIWNAHVATGTPLAEYGAVADVLAVCLSKGLGAPVGSLMVGTPGRHRRGPGLAQADGRRHAAGRDPRGGRPLRARPPRRAAGRGPRERPAARRGVRRGPRHRRHEHRGGRRTRRGRGGRGRPGRGRARRGRRRRGPSAW